MAMVAIYLECQNIRGLGVLQKLTLISKHSSNAIVIKIIWGERSTLTNQDVSWHVEQSLLKPQFHFPSASCTDHHLKFHHHFL